MEKKYYTKELFILFILQITGSSYISTNIIDKNIKNIYKLIQMSF